MVESIAILDIKSNVCHDANDQQFLKNEAGVKPYKII